jgi:hypothetical protein
MRRRMVEELLKNGFPILKLKKLQIIIYNKIPDDFDPYEYLSIHSDLKHMTNES